LHKMQQFYCTLCCYRLRFYQIDAHKTTFCTLLKRSSQIKFFMHAKHIGEFRFNKSIKISHKFGSDVQLVRSKVLLRDYLFVAQKKVGVGIYLSRILIKDVFFWKMRATLYPSLVIPFYSSKWEIRILSFNPMRIREGRKLECLLGMTTGDFGTVVRLNLKFVRDLKSETKSEWITAKTRQVRTDSINFVPLINLHENLELIYADPFSL
jgi:hypothetical protein